MKSRLDLHLTSILDFPGVLYGSETCIPHLMRIHLIIVKQNKVNEKEFIESIDCCFPYTDRVRALALAQEACQISANAAFAVIDEVVRPGHGAIAPERIRLDVLQLMQTELDHPLTKVVLPLANQLVRDIKISVDDALLVMQQVARFPGEYSALSIAYFAADDTEDILDAEHNQIRAAWEAA